MPDPTQEHAPVSAALAEAQNILNAAEQKAKAIINSAEKESQAIREEAYEKGIALGKRAVVEHAIRAFKEQAEVKDQLENAAAQLTYQILEHVFSLRDTSVIHPIQELTKKMMSNIPGGGNIEINFCDEHTEALDFIRTDLEELARGSKLILRANPEIPESLVMIRTDFGEIQVSLKEFFEEITKQMKLLPKED